MEGNTTSSLRFVSQVIFFSILSAIQLAIEYQYCALFFNIRCEVIYENDTKVDGKGRDKKP